MKSKQAPYGHGSRPGVAILHLTPKGLRGTVLDDSWTGFPMSKSRLAKSGLQIAALAVVILSGLFAGSAASAANFLEKNFYLFGPRYDGVTGTCEGSLYKVAARFAEKESTFWNSTLQITAFQDIHEIAYQPWQSDSIPRRYCTGIAVISDGKPRKVNFSIIEDGGFASIGESIEFCVVGLDRNWAFNPACKMARP